MKPRELLSDFDFGPGDVRAELLYVRMLLSYLADHVYAAELSAGGQLHDAMDFTAWLRELSDEARKLAETAARTKVSWMKDSGTRPKVTCRTSIPAPQPRYSSEFCPDCGHIHADPSECGFPTGSGGKVPCRCERKVTA